MIAYGYPASIIATTLGQPSFLTYFNLIDPVTGQETDGAPSIISAMNAVFQVGGLFGIIGGSFVMDRWGRKAGMYYAAALSFIGGAPLTGSVNPAMFIVFRFFAGAGSYSFDAVTPVYAAELAPPGLRGFFVGVTGLFIGVGYSLASWTGLGFYFLQGTDSQWRGPLGLALVWPALCTIGLPWMPESPRYLLRKGKAEQAWSVTSMLHGSIGGDDSFARAEYHQMVRQTELDTKTECVMAGDVY